VAVSGVGVAGDRAAARHERAGAAVGLAVFLDGFDEQIFQARAGRGEPADRDPLRAQLVEPRVGLGRVGDEQAERVAEQKAVRAVDLDGDRVGGGRRAR
jgi:hypothetical protein